jgi:hypothetical protein
MYILSTSYLLEIRRLEDGDDDSMNPRRKRERDWKHFPTGSA